MKKLIAAIIFTIFGFCGLTAQTNTFPTFSNKMLVMKITTTANATAIVSISDGTTNHSFELSTESYSFKQESQNPNTQTLANVLNRLFDQGYKLISSSTTMGGYISYNYFQKD